MIIDKDNKKFEDITLLVKEKIYEDNKDKKWKDSDYALSKKNNYK